MKWRKQKPNKPGWYWMKRRVFGEESEVSVVKVRIYGKKLCIQNWELPNDCLWAGPIREPS